MYFSFFITFGSQNGVSIQNATLQKWCFYKNATLQNRCPTMMLYHKNDTKAKFATIFKRNLTWHTQTAYYRHVPCKLIFYLIHCSFLQYVLIHGM